MSTGLQTVSPANAGVNSDTVNFSSAQFITNTTNLTKALDGGGFWGIQCPGQTLLRVITWLDTPDTPPGQPTGEHNPSFVISASVTNIGPTPAGGMPSGDIQSFGSFMTGVFADFGSWELRHFQKPTAAAFVIGMAHEYNAWTNASKHFNFGIMVEILGAQLA